MVSRRNLLLGSLAAYAGQTAFSGPVPTHAETPDKVTGPGFTLEHAGSVREAVMMQRRQAHLDLRMLEGVPHLYGAGALEGLTGEVTVVDGRSIARVGADSSVDVSETFQAKAALFVWAQVSAWNRVAVPQTVVSITQLEQ